MIARPHTICLVGAGPRGLSVLERLCANAGRAAAGTDVHIHVVDPYAPGAGGVWRTDQSRQLLMNTVAGQISVFTDASVDLEGPLEPGPSLYEWARALLAGEADDACLGEPRRDVLAEARELGPDSYPTRAFYGQYLRWVHARIVAGAPSSVTVTEHRTRAVALRDEQDGTTDTPRQAVVLADGTELRHLDAVVLAQGHLPARASRADRDLAARAARHGIHHVPPANPADVGLGAIRPGQAVIVRGLGLNFFDYMALFTAGRGGSFTRSAGRLVYHASGNEPRLYAGSRRGIPYHARGENQKGPHGRHEPLLLTPERIAALKARAARQSGLDFERDIWPLVAKEVETVYYRTLLASRQLTLQARCFESAYVHAPWGTGEEQRILDAHDIGEKDRWDWDLLARPYRDEEFSGPAAFECWLLDRLRQDVAEARAGNVHGPRKAALDVLRDLRNEIRQLVDHGGLHGDSHRDALDGWFTPLNAFLSIGPPTRRVEEMTALIEAGVLSVVGPGMRVDVDGATGALTAHSPVVPGSGVRAEAIVEARLPEITLRGTGDALLRSLLDAGECAPYRIRTRDGGWHETDGLAVTPRPFRLLDARGRAHPRRFAFGVPTESVHWVTAAGIRPGVNSVTLTDSDAIARAVLACSGAALDGRGAGRTGAVA
ncbi:FAD/NAD(P)-binding protein [Streptomyces sp. AV19]|uniref:FAD/NAD(P)-binding protein n=1 Tax=Streptomyces sp. AV19 TaxID=2793068 RepID=UPI0024134FC0|nr:FAD/NAD(P)-binding protein [Streptomyces sp. AV19]MDG4533275.1 FAD/NAD(P)-binding protein [Streptomyces sp. AV19]